MQDEIDAGALTPAPRERCPLPNYDSSTGITLLIPVPDFRQMSYFSVDDMMADARVSQEAVVLKLPIAIANIRSKLSASIPLVTRARTTYNTYVVPPPSNYVRYNESLPMLPNPVLHRLSKEDRTFSGNKALSKKWHKYSSRKHPMSREQEKNQKGQDLYVNLTTLQTSFFLSNLGNLLRRPGLGKRKMMVV